MTADVQTSTRLRCDKGGCRTTFPAEGDTPLVAGHLYTRSRAAAQGWTFYVMDGDFCPEHSPDERDKT